MKLKIKLKICTRLLLQCLDKQAVELQERIVSKAISDHEEEELDVYDDYKEKKPEDYQELEKVTTLAVNKFLDGNVSWKKIKLE